jgi:hypothetical protein
MKTSEKQERMTSASVKAYNDVIYNSGVLIPSGHMHAQDLYNLTQGRFLPMFCLAEAPNFLFLFSVLLPRSKQSVQADNQSIRSLTISLPVLVKFNMRRFRITMDYQRNERQLQTDCNFFAGCGADCTEDGVHYINAVYDAAMQMYVNSLHLYPSG